MHYSFISTKPYPEDARYIFFTGMDHIKFQHRADREVVIPTSEQNCQYQTHIQQGY